MKKKGIILAAAALAAAAGVTGCVHHCPPPEESLDCYPICREVKSGNQRNVKAEWEAFKLTPDYPFIPTRRYRKIDEIGKLVADLAYHVKRDIVIPYVELDREGLISEFYEFRKDVAAAREAQNCTYQEAMKLTWEYWMRLPDGPAKCRRLVNALPLLHKLSANNQIRFAILRLGPRASRLALLILRDPAFKREVTLLKRDWDMALRGNPRAVGNLSIAVLSATSAAVNVDSLIRSIGYLSTYLDDKSSQREALEQFIADIGRMSEEGERHTV